MHIVFDQGKGHKYLILFDILRPVPYYVRISASLYQHYDVYGSTTGIIRVDGHDALAPAPPGIPDAWISRTDAEQGVVFSEQLRYHFIVPVVKRRLRLADSVSETIEFNLTKNTWDFSRDFSCEEEFSDLYLF